MDFDHSTDTITPDIGTSINFTGDISPSGKLISSTTASITPAGTTQGTATAITNAMSIIPTSFATASAGVILPTPVLGANITVANRGTVLVNIYPGTGHTIDVIGVNAPAVIGVNSVISFIGTSSTTWAFSQKSFVQSSPITVSVSAPSSPNVNDLWLSI